MVIDTKTQLINLTRAMEDVLSSSSVNTSWRNISDTRLKSVTALEPLQYKSCFTFLGAVAQDFPVMSIYKIKLKNKKDYYNCC